MSASEQHTLLVGCGPQSTSQSLLRGAAQATPLLLLDQAPPTWQWDYIGDADTASLDDTPALRRAALRLAGRHGIGGVLAGSAAAIPAAADLCALLTGGIRQDLCADDAVLQSTLRAAGLPSLPTLLADTAGGAVSAARALGFPVVLKQARAHGRSAVLSAGTIAQTVAAFEAIAAGVGPDDKVVVQERADGTEVEVLCITRDGRAEVLAIARHAMNGGWCDRLGVTAVPGDPLAGELGGLAQQVAEALGVDRGLSSLTVRLLPTGPRIVSVHVHVPFERRALWEAVTGRDLGAVAALLEHGEDLALAGRRPALCVTERVLRASTPGTVYRRPFYPAGGIPEDGAQVVWHTAVGASVEARARLCTVTAVGPSRASAETNLADALASVLLRVSPPAH